MHRNSKLCVCEPTCCDPCWCCRRSHCTLSVPHHVAGVAAGKVSKTTMHFCYGTFVSFQGGTQGPHHVPSTFFLSSHIAWQFILGSAGWHLRHKADKALCVTSMRPVGSMTMPLAMQSCKMDNTALNILAKRCRKRGISCSHNFIFRRE